MFELYRGIKEAWRRDNRKTTKIEKKKVDMNCYCGGREEEEGLKTYFWSIEGDGGEGVVVVEEECSGNTWSQFHRCGRRSAGGCGGRNRPAIWRH